MLNKSDISESKQKLFVYIALAVITLAVWGQVHVYDFINYDDPAYITENSNIKSGITLEGIRWSFTTKYFGIWNPLVWLSFMLDYELYGLNAGGYHVTNLILHILSTLLLFWLFNRMTKEIWPSAFVAAFFALHPLHVESVAWISERKDVLSAFFWMLTLCLYVYYTEKPALKRYLLVLCSFVLALMSKPMVVTLPLIMILLDYWPLSRFESQRGKGNPVLWQLKEKLPFFVLSAILVIITFYTPNEQNTSITGIPFISRLINSPVVFVTYLVKTFWPQDMAVFYPFPSQIPILHITGATILIIIITSVVIVMSKRIPFLFVGWFWFATTIAPLIGIKQIGDFAMADRYHYLPSIGLAVILAWGIPSLINNENLRRKILYAAAIVFLAFLSFLTWKQCGYWKSNITLFSHALNVTKNNYLAHNNLGLALFAEGKTKEAIVHYNEVIRIKPFDVLPYHNKGIVYDRLGQYNLAIETYNEAIKIKPDDADGYLSRAIILFKLGQHQQALEDLTEVIRLKPDYADAYYIRGNIYINLGRYQKAIEDLSKAINLSPASFNAYNNRAFIYLKLGRYQQAYDDYSKAILIKPDYADAYNNRAFVYLSMGNIESGCADAKKACKLGTCSTLQLVKEKGLCR